MDREQDELQFLGFFDVSSESVKLIDKWKNIFLKIYATLILPLSLFFLSHIEISMLFSDKITHNEDVLGRTAKGTATYYKISNILSTECVKYFLIKVVCFTFLVILSLLSISGIVYAAACIYYAKEITFKEVVSAVTKVSKRLMLTFLCSFAVIIVYNILAFLILVILLNLFTGNSIGRASSLGVIVSSLYLIGSVYISLIWHLASVISVLEDNYGFHAMMKSKALIKGKRVISSVTFTVISLCLVGITFLSQKYAAIDENVSIFYHSVLAVSTFFLFGPVIQR